MDAIVVYVLLFINELILQLDPKCGDLKKDCMNKS